MNRGLVRSAESNEAVVAAERVDEAGEVEREEVEVNILLVFEKVEVGREERIAGVDGW